MSQNFEILVDYVDEILKDIEETDYADRGELLAKIRALALDWERDDCADIIVYLMGRVNNE